MALQPEILTWTALLARWVQLAQASVALPKDDEGERWRASLPAIINLQAVTFALGDIGQLDAAERALALDKADILIRENLTLLRQTWGDAMTPTLRELIGDAETTLNAVRAV